MRTSHLLVWAPTSRLALWLTCILLITLLKVSLFDVSASLSSFKDSTSPYEWIVNAWIPIINKQINQQLLKVLLIFIVRQNLEKISFIRIFIPKIILGGLIKRKHSVKSSIILLMSKRHYTYTWVVITVFYFWISSVT